jgi:hypothetical protein
MSTREKLKRDIDLIPEESLAAASEIIAAFIIISASVGKTESELEKAYQTLQKYKGRIDRPIDYKKERLEYLDERYGSVN